MSGPFGEGFGISKGRNLYAVGHFNSGGNRFARTGITTIPNSYSSFAVNDSGSVVGVSNSGGAFVSINGVTTIIAQSGSYYGQSVARSINNAGDVVGQDNSNSSSAFLYSNGLLTILPPLSANYSFSDARAINDNGAIAGYSTRGSGAGISRAFLYANGAMQDLGTLGGESSYAMAINNSGVVAGYSHVPSGYLHGFIYQNGVMKDLGALSEYQSSLAMAINESGTAVGWAAKPDGNGVAVMFKDGLIYDLNNLIPPQLNPGLVTLTYAYGINDGGQIVGVGVFPNGTEHAILLSPVPETTLKITAQGIQVQGTGFLQKSFDLKTWNNIDSSGSADLTLPISSPNTFFRAVIP